MTIPGKPASLRPELAAALAADKDRGPRWRRIRAAATLYLRWSLLTVAVAVLVTTPAVVHGIGVLASAVLVWIGVEVSWRAFTRGWKGTTKDQA